MRVAVAGQQRGLEEEHATAHTEGDPPSTGSTILANIGWIANSSSAERKVVAVNTHITRVHSWQVDQELRNAARPPAAVHRLGRSLL